jgi:hypothetical protein
MSISMFHGLMAYTDRRAIDPITLACKAKGTIGAEICTADKPIGQIGLLVAGQLTALFERDVRSKVRNGQRVVVDHWACDPDTGAPYVGRHVSWCSELQFTRQTRDGVVHHNPNQTEVENFCKASQFDYCEGWMIPTHIEYVWVGKNANNENYWHARALSLKLRVPLVEVDAATRLWNVEVSQTYTDSWANRPMSHLGQLLAA